MFKQKIVYDGRGYVSGSKTVFSDLGNTLKLPKSMLLGFMQKVGNIVVKNTIPLTPKDTNALRESVATETFETSNTVGVTVSFGNDEVDYAQIVHNDMEPKNWTEPGTGPLYLSKGVQASTKEIEEYLANAIKTALTAGKK